MYDHIISSSSSHATNIIQVMTLTETLMGWTSSAGKAFYTRPTKHYGLLVKLNSQEEEA